MPRKENPLDKFEKAFRAGIGVEYDITSQGFIVEASRDNIRNFADAVGDANPLWLDGKYAKKSRFKGITAPPTFLYNVNHGSSPALGPPGQPPTMDLVLLYAGAELEFFRPIYLGDTFSAVKAKSTAIERKKSKSLGDMLFCTGEASYYNRKNELIGLIRTTICRFLPQEKQSVHIDRKSRPGFEMRSPDVLAFERKRRGGLPRYWEDVKVGEEMPVMEKGLLTMMEIIRFGLFVSGMPRRIERKREGVEVGFSREKMQKRAGLENASDYGPQRVCWLGQFLTDWMGDDGTLKKYSCQVRHPSIMGDSNFVKGKVTGKRVDNGEYLVDCEIWVENQAGLVTAPGKAIIALPSKG